METDSSRSRRDFLTQATATGLFGMTGMGLLTEAASATSVTEKTSCTEPSALHTTSNPAVAQNDQQSTDPQKKELLVTGGTFSGGEYRVRVSGEIYGRDLELSDDVDSQAGYARGRVFGLVGDTYLFTGNLLEATVLSGTVYFNR